MQTIEIESVASFYDAFQPRLLRDYVHGNFRVAAAVSRVCSVIDTSRRSILDVGCGIGFTSSEYRRQRPWVHVHGVDISPNNIDVANKRFSSDSIKFSISSLSRAIECDEYDVVALIDVYEHIPRDNWDKFNSVLAECLATDGVLVITTPSELHQQYLAAKNPQGLQMVDETVGLEDMLRLAAALNGKLLSYDHVSIWNTNDYLHVVIDRKPKYTPKFTSPIARKTVWQRIRSRIVNEHTAEIDRRRTHVRNALGIEVE